MAFFKSKFKENLENPLGLLNIVVIERIRNGMDYLMEILIFYPYRLNDHNGGTIATNLLFQRVKIVIFVKIFQ